MGSMVAVEAGAGWSAVMRAVGSRVIGATGGGGVGILAR